MTKKATKKQTKKTPTAKKPTQPKKSIIEVVKPEVVEEQVLHSSEAVIERLPVQIVEEGFHLFTYAFQPDGMFEDDQGDFYTDPRFLAIWKTWLCICGWDEDEYWAAIDDLPHEKCEKCEAEEKEKQKQEAEAKAKNIN